jgi:hypothetical protein
MSFTLITTRLTEALQAKTFEELDEIRGMFMQMFGDNGRVFLARYISACPVGICDDIIVVFKNAVNKMRADNHIYHLHAYDLVIQMSLCLEIAKMLQVILKGVGLEDHLKTIVSKKTTVCKKMAVHKKAIYKISERACDLADHEDDLNMQAFCVRVCGCIEDFSPDAIESMYRRFITVAMIKAWRTPAVCT